MRVLTDAACIRVLCDGKLLIGIGNQLLLVYLSSNGQTHRRNAPLPRLVDKINGIEALNVREHYYLVIIHAGRTIYSTFLDGVSNTFSECVLLVIPEQPCMQPVPFIRRRLNDWINRIVLLSSTELCIVTSHGVAALLKRAYNNHSLQWEVVDKSPCEDGSTLYCSTITGQQWADVIVLSGTALGLLLIWSVEGPSRGKVLKSVSAHNGVIFSIACNFDSGLLTTTSDDRSIKFWNVKLSNNKDNCSRTVELREERYCFAHTARVFQCRIIHGARQTLVASIGEDSHLCLWRIDGNLVLKKRLDEGPTLWSMDYDPASVTIFVTASNGNMHKYCIEHIIEDGGKKNGDKNAMVDISPNLQRNEHLAKVKFLNNGYLVGVTNHNQVLIVDSNGTIVQSLDRKDDFKCSIIESGTKYLYLAGGCCIQLYNVGQQKSTQLVRCENVAFVQKSFTDEDSNDAKEGTIRSLNYCTRSKTVAICDTSGRCIVFDETLTEIVSCHRIPNSSERWLTAFVVLNETLLLTADRSGHLYLFDKAHVTPVFKLSNVHGKLGITSIIVEESDLKYPDIYNFRTTGHDGRICELSVNCNARKLELLTCTKSVIGWIDRPLVRGSKTFYLGFNDSHFFMVDDTNETYIQFDCGGGHRCWDFFYEEMVPVFTYVFIQHKRLKRVQFTPRNNVGSELVLSRFNWHTRACNVLQVAKQESGSYLLLSGGEDNILRINALSKREIVEAPRKHIFSHISSIKTIIVKRLGNGALLMISAGGRAQICLTSIDLVSLRIKQEYEYMLLATDTERSRWKTNRRSTFDPETKFMCATLLSNDRIVFGCSDGYVRIYQLSMTDEQFAVSLIGETFYGRCILKMVSIDHEGASIFISMASDGYLCFWDTSCPKEPIFRHRHHSSGVNAVDVTNKGGGRFVFATGGDDQSVAVSLVEIKIVKGKLQVQVVKELSEKYLHTAQVTGIKLLNDDKMISVGVDQQLYVSNFSNYGQLSVEHAINTCIADVKGISYLEDEKEIIVYGCGIEIVDLPLQKNNHHRHL